MLSALETILKGLASNLGGLGASFGRFGDPFWIMEASWGAASRRIYMETHGA